MFDDVAAALAAGVGLSIIAGSAGAVAGLTRRRQLDRNGVIGLRTSKTKASDAAWYAAHDAARPWLLCAAWTAIAFAAVLVLLSALGAADELFAGLLVVGYVVVVGILIAAAVVADRAAGGAPDTAVE